MFEKGMNLARYPNEHGIRGAEHDTVRLTHNRAEKSIKP